MDRFNIAKRFIRPVIPPSEVNIVTVLLRGSFVYHFESSDLCMSKDWDGVVILPSKFDIALLVNKRRDHLRQILSIVDEESVELRVPISSDPLWPFFGGVRFVGRRVCGTKEGVELLSLEYITSGRITLNLLSFKDRRLCEGIIQQSTTLSNNLVTLHEQLGIFWALSYLSPRKPRDSLIVRR
jgi:hypothetical protein